MAPLVFSVTVNPGAVPDDVAQALEQHLSEPGALQVEARPDRPRQIDPTQVLEHIHTITLIIAIAHTLPDDVAAGRSLLRKLRELSKHVPGVQQVRLDQGDRQTPIEEVSEQDITNSGG